MAVELSRAVRVPCREAGGTPVLFFLFFWGGEGKKGRSVHERHDGSRGDRSWQEPLKAQRQGRGQEAAASWLHEGYRTGLQHAQLTGGGASSGCSPTPDTGAHQHTPCVFLCTKPALPPSLPASPSACLGIHCRAATRCSAHPKVHGQQLRPAALRACGQNIAAACNKRHTVHREQQAAPAAKKSACLLQAAAVGHLQLHNLQPALLLLRVLSLPLLVVGLRWVAADSRTTNIAQDPLRATAGMQW